MTAPDAALSPHIPAVRVPRATYRLQLHRGFPFARAQAVLDYLVRLGISDAYLSPIWQATPGSTHGYDVTDHTRVNAELGGLAGLTRFSDALRERQMGLLLDFVPNHMGVGSGKNVYWEDVLEHGQASRYAHFFDIDWEPLKRSLAGKVLLPVLGDLYGRVLERGELKVERLQSESGEPTGRFGLCYFGRVFPLSPRTLATLLRRAAELCRLSDESDLRAELNSVALQMDSLPSSNTSPGQEQREDRARETTIIARRLRELGQTSPSVARALDAAVKELNADPEALDRLIREQNYRLSYWRAASEQINYRRFFDINDLAALRMEDPRVFDWAHSLLLDLVREGRVTGIRLDHTDGLYDPAGYFQQLQNGAAAALGMTEQIGQPALYVVAEKILEPGEKLPGGWPIHGTTGYDFLAQLGGAFVDAGSQEELTAMYRRWTGDRQSFGETLHDTKELILRTSLSSELYGLAERLERLAERDLRWRDFTLSTLRAALREVIASFPVYRTYLREDGQREPGDDTKIGHAIRDARLLNRELDESVFDFLHEVLTLTTDAPLTRQAYAEFALRFQQLTGPVTAKGAEDTAFYRYVRLLSLNEVGGDPALYGTPPATFHAQTKARGLAWPHAMLSTSTHDTKRGEDTRARIAVLSEVPQTWAAYLSEWSRLTRPFERYVSPGPEQSARSTLRMPSAADTYALFQTVLGVWPLDGNFDGLEDRLVEYALKSAREAKTHTTWGTPDTEYEELLENLVRGLMDSAAYRRSVEELHARLSPYGAQNSLSGTLIRLTAPGVPDTYQGSEIWNQSLVDPDNRRPVNYTDLSRRLTAIEERFAAEPLALTQEVLERYQDGDVKLLVTWAALQARQRYTDLFMHGDYAPIEAGKFLLAYSRTHGEQTAVIAAPRLSLTLTRERQPWPLGETWGKRELTLPSAGTWRNVLTGEVFRVRGKKLALAQLFEHFPLALLIRE
ncbi:malto-oligosyltrehalose synthase [Deinococcus sp. KNUC1210]|uniref:malto-oligosyltrehalose synthase n=1 Tax=Deinococcus sp. KNUC1210 TaxID=2917691 RepID=UPI001EEF928C|nr:malto-oligosyltrehalose synthase [Deinococcus sp. KNUC1210]ULH15821.1 malto-oligosyltrehalose synthase [Deinococcus sp. KNUC1210]